MKISDFKPGESFAYIDISYPNPGELNGKHISLGRLEKQIDATMYDFYGAEIYYFPGSHTSLNLGGLGDSNGSSTLFIKDVKPVKREAIELLFRPTKTYKVKGP